MKISDLEDVRMQQLQKSFSPNITNLKNEKVINRFILYYIDFE